MTENDVATYTGGVLECYLALRNEPAANACHRALTELWIEDGTYTDPLVAAEGGHEIEAVISGARERFPRHVFLLLDDVDAHHDIVRFGWELVPEGGGESVVIGFDVADITADGRLRNVYGFLDKVPAA